jgi:UDP-N-acetylenolpyruvoylglucosamine reductase
MVTVPAGGQFPTGEKGGLFRLSASARTSPEPSVTIVAVGPAPEKSAISGSKPPGEMTDPAALVPPPNPHVWLGVGEGDRAPLAEARAAVLTLRRGKGMVLDPGDPDTRSAGSFFTNPVIGRRQYDEVRRRAAARSGQPETEVSVPHFPAPDGLVKVPAGWLIEHAGFTKGYPGHGSARISTKHTLALTNLGDATAASLIGLAREIRDGVHQAFGVDLVSEPVLIGAAL